MEFKDIKRIVELMGDHGLTHFKLEQDESKLELRKGNDLDLDTVQKLMSLAPAVAPAPVAAAAPVAAPVPAAATPGIGAAAADGGTGDGPGPDEVEIKSELVGTFYTAPSPDEPAFVKEGSQISDDTVVCIVEAMKVMNQIQAGVSGTITKVVAENGSPVQYGDPLFYVKKG